MGLEPTNGGTTIHCLNHLATLALSFFILASLLAKMTTQNPVKFLLLKVFHFSNFVIE